jgi:hypothetical protein
MTVNTESQLADRQRAEAAALAHVVARLEDQFPELDRESIERIVRGRQDDFRQSAIRDFVPILVERSAREDIQQEVQRFSA